MSSLVVLLAACAGTGLKDPTFPTGSTTMVSVGRSLYAVNTFDGTVVRTDPDGGSFELELGGEPTRIARVGDELWVTLRAEREVVVLGTTDGAPAELDRLPVGAEPHGIVATEDGSRVYVALSQQDEVAELDGATRKELRRWKVMDDPRWLALHPCDCALFVASAYQAPIARIDLGNDEISYVDVPEAWRPDDGTGSGGGGRVGGFTLSPRHTGDLAISPTGDALVSPTTYVDNVSTGDQPVVSGADITPPTVPYYTGATTSVGLQLSISKFNPALVAVPLNPGTGEIVETEPVIAVFVGGFGAADPIRSYVSSATFDPDGTTVYATMEASDAVSVVDLRPVDGQEMDLSVHPDHGEIDTGGAGRAAPSEGNFYERSQAIVEVGANPSAVVVDPSGVVSVHERGGRSVARFGTGPIRDHLETLKQGEVVVQAFSPDRTLPAGTVHLSADLEEGRRLFYSARDPRVSAVGAGVSCSTCHFEGRNDGLTWAFDDTPRQTPSLAGKVSDTAPVTWTDGVSTVSLEAQITSAGRMGGRGLTEREASQLAAFVDAGREVDVQQRGVRDALVDRGAALFADPTVGCAECHSGPRTTDHRQHPMFGVTVDTPTLTGIDATAPYFHDGSAATLRDVVERSRDGSMGDTSGLSDADLDALVAFLRTL